MCDVVWPEDQPVPEALKSLIIIKKKTKRNVTTDTALGLAQYLGVSADFWMNLPSAHEVDLAREQKAPTQAAY